MRQFNDWRIFFMFKPVIIYHAYDYHLQNLSFSSSKILFLYKHNFLIKVFLLNFCLGKKHYEVSLFCL